MGNELDRTVRLKKLPDYVLNVLSEKQEHLQLAGLKAELPEFAEISDDDWYSVLKDMESDTLIQAHFINTGITNKTRAAFNIAITARGRQLTPELPLRGKKIPLDEKISVQVVTLSGECFRATFERTEAASERDGVYYLFDLEDLIKNRGHRLVSLFRSGQDKELRSNFESLIANARLNVIRRAIDSRIFSFDSPFEEHKYLPLTIKPEDFVGGAPTSESEIRQFIIHKAYWLGYRYNLDPAHPMPIQFDAPADLDYLRTSSDVVKRGIWLLSQQGILDKVMESFARPTAKLIEEYESSLMPQKTRRDGRNEGPREATSRIVFVVHGHDEGMKHAVARFLEKLDLRPVILHEQANKGRTIIEKFEAHSADAGFAVVLLSPDDTGAARGKEIKQRARQNVILELGYFIGRLGRARVCALYVDGVELPSDLHGVLWIPFDGGAGWQLTLAREIKEAGIDVDLNQAY